MKIHYIGYYSLLRVEDKHLNIAPSAKTKMDYIISSIKKNNHDIIIYSPASSNARSYTYFPQKHHNIEKGIDLVSAPTIGTPCLLMKIIARILVQINVFIYLIKRSSNDVVIIYHSNAYKHAVFLSRCFIKCKIIYEVEEIYAAAWRKSTKSVEKEINYLSKADAYIYVNDLMKTKFSFKKPSAVCYGTYRVNSSKKSNNNNDNIRILYAGVIGEDSSLAVEIIKQLPSNYELVIAGYGVSLSILQLENEIVAAKSNNKNLRLSFVGCLHGKQYDDLLSSCQIGLCTRVLENEYSDYTFPSKILVYLSNGLLPISSPLSCINESSLKEYVVFTKDLTPQSIANSILKTDLKNTNYIQKQREKIQELDQAFCAQINNLITF